MKSGPFITGPGKRQESHKGLVSKGSAPASIGIIDDLGREPFTVCCFFLAWCGDKVISVGELCREDL